MSSTYGTQQQSFCCCAVSYLAEFLNTDENKADHHARTHAQLTALPPSLSPAVPQAEQLIALTEWKILNIMIKIPQ
jgi:hypothetical protein